MGKYLACTGYFWQLSIQGQPEVIRCISDFSDFQQPRILKRSDNSSKLTTIFGQVLFVCGFKVTLRSFDAYPICISKMVAISVRLEQNGLKIDPQG